MTDEQISRLEKLQFESESGKSKVRKKLLLVVHQNLNICSVLMTRKNQN